MLKIILLGLISLGMSAWTLLILYFSPLMPANWRSAVVVLYALTLMGLFAMSSKRWMHLPIAIAAAGLFVTALYFQLKPKTGASWRPEVAVPAAVKFRGNFDESLEGASIQLSNVRDFSFANGEVTEARYLDRMLDLDKLTSVDFLISYWDEERAVAHTMMSFQFEGEEPLCISVEARRELGESWNVLPGLFRQFELFYVLGTEADLIGQRIHDRGERVYRFPTRLNVEDGRQFLANVLEAAEALRQQPVFYQTLLNNCTTTLVHHLNEVWPERAPYEKRLWLNGYTPEHAWDAGLIASEMPLADYIAASEIRDYPVAQGTRGPAEN